MPTRFIPGRLVQARQERGWDTRKLRFEIIKRRELEYTERQVQAWEKGSTHPNRATVSILAEVLEKPVDYFYDLLGSHGDHSSVPITY